MKIRVHPINALSIALSTVPLIYYFTIFFKFYYDIPHEDDYDTVLFFLNELVKADSIIDKISLSITSVHNEHILLFNRLLAWLYYSIAGEINFKGLQLISSLLVVLTWILFLMLINKEFQDIKSVRHIKIIKSLVIVTASILFFNLSYYESIFRATDQPQKLGLIIITFFSIHSFLKDHQLRAILLASIGFLISANGIFIPITIFFLTILKSGKWMSKDTVSWSIVSFLVILTYWLLTKDAPKNKIGYLQIADIFSWLKLIGHYLASSGSVFHSKGNVTPILAGIIINFLFLYVIVIRPNPKHFLIYGIMIFFMFSFLSTAYGRADEGIHQALSPRYKIYASIFSVTYIVFIVVSYKKFLLVHILLVSLSISWTMPIIHKLNYPIIKARSENLNYAINQFTFDSTDTIKLNYPIQDHPRRVLKESAMLGIYSNSHIEDLLRSDDKKILQ